MNYFDVNVALGKIYLQVKFPYTLLCNHFPENLEVIRLWILILIYDVQLYCQSQL